MERVKDKQRSNQKPSDNESDTKNVMETVDYFQQMDYEYFQLNGWLRSQFNMQSSKERDNMKPL